MGMGEGAAQGEAHQPHSGLGRKGMGGKRPKGLDVSDLSLTRGISRRVNGTLRSRNGG